MGAKRTNKSERDKQFRAARRVARGGAEGAKGAAAGDKPRCGLCGKTGRLVRAECCGNWVCDDEHKYTLFSYARNSCHRNHRRYTLCGMHHGEGHEGDWKTCAQCREMMEPEMYVYHGTNEYNFEVLPNPPAYKPTHCGTCGRVIVLSEGGYSCGAGGYRCMKCTERELGRPIGGR